MPKKSKKNTTAKPNKSAFVRSLSFDMPSADVIAKAKARGMTLTRNDVHAIRAIARRKTEAPKSAGRRARRTGAAGGVNKSAFVRSLPRTMSAAEVIARGKAKGITLSAAQIYTIRANARRKGLNKAASAAPTRGGRSASAQVRFVRGSDSREAEFIAAALDLGLARAEALIKALRSKAADALM